MGNSYSTSYWRSAAVIRQTEWCGGRRFETAKSFDPDFGQQEQRQPYRCAFNAPAAAAANAEYDSGKLLCLSPTCPTAIRFAFAGNATRTTSIFK